MWKKIAFLGILAAMGVATFSESTSAQPIGPPRSLVSIRETLFVLCGDPIRLFEVSSVDGEIVREIPVPSAFPNTGNCGLAAGGSELFLTASDTVAVLDIRSGTPTRMFDLPAETTSTGLAFVPGQGLLLADADTNSRLQYLSPADGTFIRDLPGAAIDGRIHGLDAGPMGRLFGWNAQTPGIEEINEVTGERVDFVAGGVVLETQASGLGYTGRSLFLSGPDNELIKVIDPNHKFIVRAFPAPLVPVCGLAGGAITNVTVVFSDPNFHLPLFGSFRSVGGKIAKGDIRIAREGIDPASAATAVSYDYPALFATEPYHATLELTHFPAQSGTFNVFGIGTDDAMPAQTTPFGEAFKLSVKVVFDFVDPGAVISQPAPGSILTFFDMLPESTAFAVIGQATDPPPGLRHVELLVRGLDKGEGFVVEDSIEFSNETEVDVEFVWDPPADGDYEIALRAFDSFQNMGMSPVHAVTVDRAPPTPTHTPTSTSTPTITPTPTLGSPLATDANILFSSPPLEVFSAVTMVELDGDTDPEFVFGTDRTGDVDTGAGVYAINLDGSPVAGNWPVILNTDVRSSPAASDIDLDGLDEIVVGTYGPPNTILILDNDGTTMGTASSTFSVISSPAIGNLDDDPQLEITIGTSDGTLLVLDADGSALPGWPVVLPTSAPQFHTRNDVDSSPAIGDIDGDGDPEIVVISDEAFVYAYHTDGTPVSGFPFRPDPLTFNQPVSPASHFAGPVLADVDGDGTVDVIAALANARVYALDGDGSELPGFPLFFPPDEEKGIAIPARPGDDILSTPAVGDLDGDGLLELAVAFYGGPEDQTRLYVYDLAGPANGERMTWPMFQQDGPRRSIYPGDTDGDVNRDGEVDETDAGRLAETWHRFSTMPRFHPSIDFDQSREIDAIDLLALLRGFSGSAAPAATNTPAPPTATPVPEVSPTATPTPTIVLGTGDVQVTLTWDTAADIDLWVMDPSGETIFWGNDTSASGGALDVDDTGACEGAPGGGPENIFWPEGGAPTGTYSFQVDYFSDCSISMPATHWMVTVRRIGQPDLNYQGVLNPNETSPLEMFTLGTKGATGTVGVSNLVPENLPQKDYQR